MRVVLDSNILVRAFVNSQGLAHQLLLTVLASDHVLLTSNEMLAELTRVLRYPRLFSDHGEDEEAIYEFAGWLRHAGELTQLNALNKAPIRDAQDIIVLQTALSGKADVLCTQDRDFYEPPASIFLAKCGISAMTDVQLMRVLRP